MLLAALALLACGGATMQPPATAVRVTPGESERGVPAPVSQVTAMVTPVASPAEAPEAPAPSPPAPTPVEPSGAAAVATPAATRPATDLGGRFAAVFGALPGTSAAVVVLPDGSWFTDNAEAPLRSASVIKLWIAAATFDAAAGGTLELSETHTVRKDEQASGTGILNQPRYVGSTYTFAQLVETMLVYSDNTAADILIDRLGGVQVVTDYAAGNGYPATRLQRLLGAIDRSNDNYTSAADCATFMLRLLAGQVVDQSASDAILAAMAERRDTAADRAYDYFGRSLPPGVTYRHVSGLNPGVRNDSGYYLEALGRPVVVAILLNDLADERAGEDAIGRAVRGVRDAWP